MLFCYQNCFEKKKCSSDREKLLKFVAEGREFAKILRSLEKFIQTVKGQNNRKIIIQIGKNYWDLEICRKS